MSKQTFDFSEALRRMRQGKKVRRKNKGLAAFYTSKDNTVKKIYADLNNDSLMFCTVPTMLSEDILATDWEEVEG